VQRRMAGSTIRARCHAVHGSDVASVVMRAAMTLQRATNEVGSMATSCWVLKNSPRRLQDIPGN